MSRHPEAVRRGGKREFIRFFQQLLRLREDGVSNCTSLHGLNGRDRVRTPLMPSLYTQIQINAPRRQVWQALIHKETWMYWNTFLYDCSPDRQFEPGREVLLSLRRVPGEEITEFQPRIMLVQPEVCLKWIAAIPGFVSEQVFELQDVGSDRTQYTHHEIFSGTLAQFFFPFIRSNEHQGIRRMARELKAFVEGRQKRFRYEEDSDGQQNLGP